MKIRPLFIADVVFVVASWVLVVLFYHRLPNPVPIHWNLSGQVNGTMVKPWGAILPALFITGLWLLLTLLPTISPRGFRMEGFLKTWDFLICLILGFILFIEIIAFLKASGAPLNLARVVPIAVGLFLSGIGNFMGKFKKNFFVGIRTPWTLANDTVWHKTHRLGAWLFVAGGLVFIGQGIWKWPLGIPFLTLLMIVVVLVVYSFWLSRLIDPPTGLENSPEERP
jgi:uncharacterized membrane protein